MELRDPNFMERLVYTPERLTRFDEGEWLTNVITVDEIHERIMEVQRKYPRLRIKFDPIQHRQLVSGLKKAMSSPEPQGPSNPYEKNPFMNGKTMDWCGICCRRYPTIKCLKCGIFVHKYCARKVVNSFYELKFAFELFPGMCDNCATRKEIGPGEIVWCKTPSFRNTHFPTPIWLPAIVQRDYCRQFNRYNLKMVSVKYYDSLVNVLVPKKHVYRFSCLIPPTTQLGYLMPFFMSMYTRAMNDFLRSRNSSAEP